MIVTKRANEPVWTNIYAYAQLPEELRRLDELAHNLWWVWNPKAQNLFRRLSPELWEATEGNPVTLTRQLSSEEIAALIADKSFMAELDDVYADFRAYLAEPADTKRPSVAYFSMEYGLTNILKIYSGGLGVLAGDYLKEASDSNVRLTAVGFLYRYGYFTQTLSPEGQQEATYEAQDFTQLPIEQVFEADGKTPMVLEVPYATHVVACHVWKVNVGRISLYLLDTDIAQNSEWDRPITHKLYGGDWENRLKQEFLLGIGGVLLLKKLGISKDVYHMNEGHAAFMNAQRLVDYVEGEGLPFDEALELVRASSIYTVHTPVPAGHDYFAEDILGKYLGHLPDRLGISWYDFVSLGRECPDSNEKFSMSVFALNTCQEANGVSLLHGKVSQEMFAPVWKGFFPEELHVGYVTNGVHLPTWASAEWQDFYRKYFGEDYLKHQTSEDTWAKVQQIPNEVLWETHQSIKLRLVEHIRSFYGEKWIRNSGDPETTVSVLEGINPNALLIGFGRRFATYKRAHLLFTDLERLERIVNNPKYPVQFLFTGKAHPADGGGQGLIKYILEISRRPEFLGKIIFLENYDMRLASKLIAGVDIWMNTPTRPLEASGTSGEKAEMNGVLNLSVLDGWWYEGYRKGAGWALTDKRTYSNQTLQDKLDATTIYDLLEKEIVPLYFNREGKPYSDGWVQTMKNSMNFIAPHYTMRRMMDDYFDRFYTGLAARSAHLHANGNKIARELVDWKRAVASEWDSLRIVSVEDSGNSSNVSNERYTGTHETIRLVLDKASLSCDLEVELVDAREEADGKLRLVAKTPLRLVEKEGTKEVYELAFTQSRPGLYKRAIRIVPTHPELPHRMDFALVRWVAL